MSSTYIYCKIIIFTKDSHRCKLSQNVQTNLTLISLDHRIPHLLDSVVVVLSEVLGWKTSPPTLEAIRPDHLPDQSEESVNYIDQSEQSLNNIDHLPDHPDCDTSGSYRTDTGSASACPRAVLVCLCVTLSGVPCVLNSCRIKSGLVRNHKIHEQDCLISATRQTDWCLSGGCGLGQAGSFTSKKFTRHLEQQ